MNTRPGLHFSSTWKCSIISTAARQFFLFSCLAIPVLPRSGSEPRPHPLPTSVLPTHSRRTYTSLLTFNCKCARQSPVQPVFWDYGSLPPRPSGDYPTCPVLDNPLLPHSASSHQYSEFPGLSWSVWVAIRSYHSLSSWPHWLYFS